MTTNNNQIAGRHPSPDFAATLKDLKAPIDPHLIKQREGWRDRNGNTHYVDYVEWHTVADILDRLAPDWSHTVREIKDFGPIIIVRVAITIGGVTREGLGTGTSESELGIKKAEHDALKRAAVKFGVARELYRKETEEIERKGALPADAGTKPLEPRARHQNDFLTEKQTGMIKALAREAGIDPEEECHNLWQNVRLQQLSKKAASFFIDHLKNLPTAIEASQSLSAPPTPKISNIADVRQFQTDPAGEGLRNEIIGWFREIGGDPNPSLAGFDRETTLQGRRDAHAGISKYVLQEKRARILKALAEQGWDEAEKSREFKKYGIDSINSAAGRQVDAIWADYKRAGMI